VALGGPLSGAFDSRLGHVHADGRMAALGRQAGVRAGATAGVLRTPRVLMGCGNREPISDRRGLRPVRSPDFARRANAGWASPMSHGAGSSLS
jgi:hypothetical protein